MKLVLYTNPDTTAQEVFYAALNEDDRSAGVPVTVTDYIAAFKIIEEEDSADLYTFIDYLVDSDEEDAAVLVESENSGEGLEKDEVISLIVYRLSQLDFTE